MSVSTTVSVICDDCGLVIATATSTTVCADVDKLRRAVLWAADVGFSRELCEQCKRKSVWRGKYK